MAKLRILSELVFLGFCNEHLFHYEGTISRVCDLMVFTQSAGAVIGLYNMKPTENTSFLRTYILGETHFGFWNTVGKAVGFLSTFVIISSLTIYQYGVYQLLLSIYSIFSDNITYGASVVGNDISRYIGEGKEEKAKKLFFEYSVFTLMVGVVLWMMIYFGAEWPSFRYQQNFVDLIQLMSWLFVLDVFYVFLNSVLKARLKFKVIASRGSYYKIFQTIVLGYYFIFQAVDLKQVILSMVFGSAISLLFLLKPAYDAWKPWKHVNMEKTALMWKLMKSYGKWDVANQLSTKVIAYVQPWIIKFVISTEAVAIYSIAQTLVGIITSFFPTKTIASLIPRIAHQKERVNRLYQYGTKYLLLWSVVSALGALIFVPPLIYIFFAKYAVSLPYFYVLLVTAPISALGVLPSVIVVVYRHYKFLFFQKVLKMALTIPLYFILVPLWGLWGIVVLGLLVSFVLLFSIFRFLKDVEPWLHLRVDDMFRFTDGDREFLKNSKRELAASVRVKYPWLYAITKRFYLRLL